MPDDQEIPDGQKLSILLLCDNNRSHANTLLDHIAAFTELSAHDICIFNPRFLKKNRLLDLDEFDVLIIHYSLLIINDIYLSPAFREKIKNYKGLKIQFIQDDYRWVDQIAAMIRFLGMHVLFTLYPTDQIARVWDASRLPGVVSCSTLAGYIPDSLLTIESPPYETRPLDIGYRGRDLPYWLGEFAQEKAWIAKGVRDRADRYGLRCDIAWREEDRIYGKDWISFICSCKAMLGTESGTSITDFDGSVQKKTDEYLAQHPGADFFEVQREVLLPYENNLPIKVLSPRMFEAIALRTALILFPGDYSGILQPWVHYIPLERDFSNMKQVVEKLHDTPFMKGMVQHAYDDIVASGRYSYRAFIKHVDDVIFQHRMPFRKKRSVKPHYFLARIERLISLLLSPAPVHPRYYLQRRSPLSILFAAAYYLKLGLYFFFCKIRGWFFLIRIFFWGFFAFRDGLSRKIAARYLCSREPLTDVNIWSFFKDLMRLGLIRQLQTCKVRTINPFRIQMQYNAQDESVIFTSLPYDQAGADTSAQCRQSLWPAVETALEAGSIKKMAWNHAAVGKPLKHPRLRFMFYPAGAEPSGTGVYYFNALVKYMHKVHP